VPRGDAYEVFDMLIVQRIVGHSAFLAVLDKTERFQHAELVRHSRFRTADDLSDIVRAQFLFEESHHDLQASWVAEHSECFTEVENVILICDIFLGSPDKGMMVMFVSHE
jgi:hypothetical protein